MAEDKCPGSVNGTCPSLERVKELEKDVRTLRDDISDLRKQNGASHERLFDRLGDIEAGERVQEEQYKHTIERMESIRTDLGELKSDNKVILDKVTSLSHKTETVESLSKTVDELRNKPAKRWETLVVQVIGLVVAAVVGMVLVKVGIS